MTVPDRLDGALARLSAALHRLHAAVEQRARADGTQADRDREFALLQDDRSRLAAELDAALAHQARLAATHDAIVQRLDRAGRTVESLLHGMAPPLPDGRAEEAA